jgi:hypothetical protein
MQYHKMTPEQRRISGWRKRRNALVAKILADALKKANKLMGRMPR